jgi:hypothetical protein
LLLFFFDFKFGVEFLVVSLACVDYDFLRTLLVREEVCVSSQESKDNVKEGVNVALLLNDAHENSIESGLLGHCCGIIDIQII